MWGVLGVVLRRILIWAFASFIGRILLGAGLALVSYKFAVDPFFLQLKSMIVSDAGQVALSWFGFFDLDKAITVIGSAYAIRVSVSALHLAKKS